ncbi:hypothetical protein [Rhodoluna limnophila]|uniref:hypothetical protein n=1 Tax=Rhodoluna limnophila TaxID=232537 RepID=UPI001105F965|nr:hypothetical protein [Rhodoluna limnophila]
MPRIKRLAVAAFSAFALLLASFATPASALPAYDFVIQGQVPSPYVAADAINCAWDGGQVMGSSDDGTHLIVSDAYAYSCYRTAVGRKVYTSADSGVTWSMATVPDAAWGAVAISSTGQYLAAAARVSYIGGTREFEDVIYVSSDFGVTWTETFATATGQPDLNWWDIEMTADGHNIIATSDGYALPYISNNYGATWAPITGFAESNWRDVGMSRDGSTVAICDNNGVSNGIAKIEVARGADIQNLSKTAFTSSVSRGDGICGSTEVSGDGNTLVATSWTDAVNGSIYIWRHSGSEWSVPIVDARDDHRTYTNGVSISDDGQIIAVGGWNGDGDELTFDGGTTWSELDRLDYPDSEGLYIVARDGSAIYSSTHSGIRRLALEVQPTPTPTPEPTPAPTYEPTPEPTPTIQTVQRGQLPNDNVRVTFTQVAGGAKIVASNMEGYKVKIYLNGILKSTRMAESNRQVRFFSASGLKGRSLRVTVNDFTIVALSGRIK